MSEHVFCKVEISAKNKSFTDTIETAGKHPLCNRMTDKGRYIV